MNTILTKIELTDNVILLEVLAPEIAQTRQPGQFIILQIDEDFGERIPLTIADADPTRGTITLVFQVVGGTTQQLAELEFGDTIPHLLGPLGTPTEIGYFGTVVCVAGGIGVAPLHPIAQAMKEAGNEVIIIMGARTREMLIMEDQMRQIADEFILVTDDGSAGRKALVTEPLAEICKERKVDKVFAIGPPGMMKYCAETTRPFAIPTLVSLNTIMVDATGMCGGCRVNVGGEAKFVCVDGPEFNGHEVDFENMMERLASYADQERQPHPRGACHTMVKLRARANRPAEVPPAVTLNGHRLNGVAPAQRIPDNRQQLGCEAKTLLDGLLDHAADLKPKERLKIPRQEMPTLDPHLRARSMDQVAVGYTPEQARLEAMRCLQCAKPQCVEACPVHVDIPGFLQAVAEGDFARGIDIIRQDSLLPAVCGRVCPQEEQCQSTCTLGRSLKDVDQAVSIGRLERFVADWERENPQPRPALKVKAQTPYKVAVVGSGPSSITVAADVRREGHQVTIFEAFHRPGGVLLYGIPEFRLPKAIVSEEIRRLEEMGVEIRTNFVVGRTRTLRDLLEKDGYDAIYLGTGAGLPKFLNIPGENLVGVFSANEYLTRSNLMKAYDRDHAHTPIYKSRRVAVIGGGNVAMDSARTALRLGADEVHLIYRRTEKEMPARREEIHHAREEGVQFQLLQNPIRILGNTTGRVNGIELLHYELGEPDNSGRARPVPISGSEEVREIDTVIVAIGNESNPLIRQTTAGLNVNDRGNIIVDETGKTSLDRVYAGGDIVLGAATVILAMGEGRRAAAAINKMLAREHPAALHS